MFSTKLPSFTPPAGPAPETLDATRAARKAEVAKSSPAPAEQSAATDSDTPSTGSPATPKEQYDESRKPVEPAKPLVVPTHVLVPVATLQAIHDTLTSHADTLRTLLPEVADDLVARTAARLKALGAK